MAFITLAINAGAAPVTYGKDLVIGVRSIVRLGLDVELL